MASKVKICNLALARIGVNPITSLTDNTIEARTCNILYEEIAKEVMTEGVFTSTINRAVLNKTTNTPAFGFTYEFQLPTDPKSLRVLAIDEETTGDHDYRIEGDKLLANISTMEIEYVGYLTDSGSYDEQLKKVIVAKLAADLAYPLTGSAGISDRLYQRYLREFEDAKSVDGQNGSNQYVVSTDLTDIR